MERYLKNCWYMAAWADEIGSAGLSRLILGQRIFFYRLGNGTSAAMLDRCPHRFAPLSRGSRDGDVLVCGYHGLRFGQDGRCVHNPFGEKIPAGTDIPIFPVFELHDIVWLWAGDAAKADPALIPDFSFVPDSKRLRSVRGYTLMQAHFEYGTDNLMDLSHIEFVHKGTFAGQGVIFAGEHTVRQAGDTLHSDWWMANIEPPSVAQGVFPPGSKVDHWLNMRWNAPAAMRLDVGACLHGSEPESGFTVPQAHILTPASEHESHYFWTASRNHDLDDANVDAYLLGLFREAFDVEDKPMIEAAYANVRGKDFWGEKPVSLGIDQGGTRARRMLEAMMAKEAANG